MEQEKRDIIGEYQRRWQELEKRGKILRAKRHREERAARGMKTNRDFPALRAQKREER